MNFRISSTIFSATIFTGLLLLPNDAAAILHSENLNDGQQVFRMCAGWKREIGSHTVLNSVPISRFHTAPFQACHNVVAFRVKLHGETDNLGTDFEKTSDTIVYLPSTVFLAAPN